MLRDPSSLRKAEQVPSYLLVHCTGAPPQPYRSPMQLFTHASPIFDVSQTAPS